MDEQIDKSMDGWTDRWIAGLINGFKYLINGQTDRQTALSMGGRTKERQPDRQIDTQID